MGWRRWSSNCTSGRPASGGECGLGVVGVGRSRDHDTVEVSAGVRHGTLPEFAKGQAGHVLDPNPVFVAEELT